LARQQNYQIVTDDSATMQSDSVFGPVQKVENHRIVYMGSESDTQAAATKLGVASLKPILVKSFVGKQGKLMLLHVAAGLLGNISKK
jgi:hypothetical protein